jgi:FkbM family methyltransferase
MYRESKPGFYAQCGQDVFLDEDVFFGRKGGAFIDIGANDGVSLSNTYFFEKTRGWTGICIEPQPDKFASLQKERTSLCIQGCVTDSPGTAEFLAVSGAAEMLSGLCSKYDPRHRARIDREVREAGAETAVIKVPCFTFAQIIEKGALRRIDYLSIDTEGGELDILKTIDFDAVAIEALSVENCYWDGRYEQLLRSKGYALIAVLGDDEIYLQQKP